MAQTMGTGSYLKMAKPVAKAVEQAAIEKPRESEYLHAINSSHNRINLTLLVITSSLFSIRRVNSLFAKEFSVEFCSDRESLFKKLLSNHVDLLLIDDGLQNDSGLELCRLIKNNPLTHHIPFMLMAQRKNSAEEAASLMLGAIDYFSTQVTPLVLLSRVQNQMERLKKNRELEFICCTDGLTGLANKTQLTTVLDREWHSARRGKYPISAIMADIDQFKVYNDTFGHIEGDKCLRVVARAVAKSTNREQDLACRFGGEEFVLLLPHTNLEGAKKVAHSLVDNVRQLGICQAGAANHATVTVSAGVASYWPSHNTEGRIDPTSLLGDADANLYLAKSQGRNQWC